MTRINHKTAELEILKYGSNDSQRERYEAGLLPEDELCMLARVQLFKEFAFPRWASTQDRDRMRTMFRHEKTCAGGVRPILEYEATDVGEMTGPEWELFKKIVLAASITSRHPLLEPDAVDVQAVSHWFTCMACKAEASKISVKVSIRWAGRVLVREFACDPERYRASESALSQSPTTWPTPKES